ncbi:MAG: hypothetical protein IKC26_01000 [Clostridia bacterium]|nr:hypothetical protein [Clostridia bacterium]
MKNRDVYDLALALLSENGDRTENGDYEERAGYLIAAFASEAEPIDRCLRERMGMDGEETDIPIYLSLEEAFPLSDRFAPAAGNYLASMLILDEDPDLSDLLFARYCDKIAAISQSIPMKSYSIADRYGM